MHEGASVDLTPRAIVNMDHPCYHSDDDRGVFIQIYTSYDWEKVSKKKYISISSGSILTPRLYIGVRLILGRRTGRSLVRRVKCFFLVIGLLSIVIFTSSYNIH